MLNTWLVLLPPLIILIAALITKKLNISLILGLLAAALIARNFSLMPSIWLFLSRLWYQITDIDNLYLYAFLILLGILISLLDYTGAAMAFAHRFTARLKNAKSTETSTLLLSSTLFIDDYLSCLTTGYVMRPLTDHFKIPRVKLAYLIHSLSGPLVVLAPISSWLALITSQLEKAGVSPDIANPQTRIVADPFYLYLKSIPYIFYSLILIASVWFVVRRRISFGPMHEQEIIAKKTGNLFGGKTPIISHQSSPSTTASIGDLVIPLILLIGSFIIGILWAGGYSLFGGTYSFFEALQKNNQTSFALFAASSITVLVTAVWNLKRNRCTLASLKHITSNGINLMSSSVIMVFLASTLGIMLREDLHTGTYLAQILFGIITISMLPFLFYCISIITAFITGSAWGTIALLFPIAIQMITTLIAVSLPANPADVAILFPVLGAVLSGAACGNHISPIAETTIMSANSAGCYPLDHAYTQFWYALPAVIAAGISFFLIGFQLVNNPLISYFISLGTGVVFTLGFLYIANKKFLFEMF